MFIDLKYMAEEIADVISESQRMCEPYPESIPESRDMVYCEEIAKQWFSAKEPIYHLFGDELIYDAGPVELSLRNDTCAQLDLVDRFADEAHSYLMSPAAIENPDLIQWGADCTAFETWLTDNAQSFFANRVTSNIVEDAPRPEIKIGMKLTRAFKFFFKNPDTVRRLQDIASTYLQLSRLTGRLCFSIDPRDYLTMSENNYNWLTCQSLDGEYRCAALSYMLDSVTIVL